MDDSDYPECVGKEVRDIYGRDLGRIVGVTFDVGGRAKSLGLGAGGSLTTVTPEQITSRDGKLVVIPQWKLESKHVGLEGGVLMKRVAALTKMVEEKLITGKLSDELFAKLRYAQKSQEVVIARVLARWGDLARADRAIDEFASLVTLQHYAGEMSAEEFDLAVGECRSMKAMNNLEILDIKKTLGIEATEDDVDSNQLVELAREFGVQKNVEAPVPQAEAPIHPVEVPSAVHAESFPEDEKPGMESPVLGNRDGPASRADDGPTFGLGRQMPGIRELEDPPGGLLVPPSRDNGPLDGLEPKRTSDREASLPSTGSGQLVSPLEVGHPGLPGAQAPADDSTADRDGRSAPDADSAPEPLLGRQVSEWVFAKIVDLEALDIRPGDYKPLKSLERR